MATTQDRPAPPAVMQNIQSALAANDVNRAALLAVQTLDKGYANPLLLNLAAYGEEQRGQYENALNYLARAERMAPRDVTILTTIGQLLSKLDRNDDARMAFERALSIEPRHAPAHHGLGLVLDDRGDQNAALAGHKRAAELDPNYPDPLGALAQLSLKANDNDAARDYAERAIRLEPLQPPANIVLASLEADAGHAEAAIRRLTALHAKGSPTLAHEVTSQRLLGRQLEQTGAYREAFSAFERANEVKWQLDGAALRQGGKETARAVSRRLKAYFETASPDAWRPAGGDSMTGAIGHVFLVGFVRSGTTLLEQVLASHPDVVALEEKLTLQSLIEAYFKESAGLDRLAALSNEEAEHWRGRYWEAVRSFGIDAKGKVFVDKSPLVSIWQAGIAKVFPDARIIFARRDPRDVVFSSFKQDFAVNASGGHFLDLEDAAHFFDEVMALSEVYRAKLSIPTHIHKHEAMVADFDAQTRALCDFIGIPWNESMRNFTDTARRRDVRTPSAEQVRQDLNSSGVGHWRHYEAQMRPVLPILQRWIDAFGYESA